MLLFSFNAMVDALLKTILFQLIDFFLSVIILARRKLSNNAKEKFQKDKQ